MKNHTKILVVVNILYSTPKPTITKNKKGNNGHVCQKVKKIGPRT